jgi:double-stranded uracil-DNA glycosylase
MARIAHSFGPVIDENSEILILGSFPSVKSRQDGFYYMHPRNRFWEIMKRLYGCDFVHATLEERTRLLKIHKVALYDVFESCDIEGSSDSSIRNGVKSDIGILLGQSKIKHIYLNGKTASAYFHRFHPSYKEMAVTLPSTSPANAAMNLDTLMEHWKIVKGER